MTACPKQKKVECHHTIYRYRRHVEKIVRRYQYGRFINADDASLLTASPGVAQWDKNLYAYCDNNPITRMDTDGEFWGFIGAAVGVLVGGISGAIGGKGANAKGLSAVYKSASSSVKRELRRANVNYATKQIAKYTLEKSCNTFCLHFSCSICFKCDS